MTGNWKINVTDNMPQKVATAMSKLSETLLGAEYTPIAYLGEQLVNGRNHAVLAEQVVTTGRDTKNIVMLIFNEKPNAMEATLVSIERVVESGAPMGGIHVNDTFDATPDAQTAWNEAFNGFVGSKVEPFAYLASQVVKGTNYIFAATVTPVIPDAETSIAIVTINPMTGTLAFANPFETKQEASLGYAFTWLKNGFGKPLGEWP